MVHRDANRYVQQFKPKHDTENLLSRKYNLTTIRRKHTFHFELHFFHLFHQLLYFCFYFFKLSKEPLFQRRHQLVRLFKRGLFRFSVYIIFWFLCCTKYHRPAFFCFEIWFGLMVNQITTMMHKMETSLTIPIPAIGTH